MAQRERPQRDKSKSFLPGITLDVPFYLRDLLEAFRIWIERLVGDPNPPAQPTALSLTLATPGVKITWVPSIGATKYLIYRNTTGNPATAIIVATTSHHDCAYCLDITSSLGAGTTLYYWVQAENSTGVKSPISSMGKTSAL